MFLHLLAAAPSTTAGIITASATVITALAVLVGALTVFVPVLRVTKRVEKEVTQVHRIVNQQRTDMMRYQVALQEALHTAGIEVPIDQSLPVIEPDGGWHRRKEDVS